MLNLWQYVVQAGWIGYVLVGVSIISVSIIFERLWYWLRQDSMPTIKERSAIINTFRKNNSDELKKNIVKMKQSPEKRALTFLHEHFDIAGDHPLDVAVSREVRSTSSNLRILDLNSAIAPMLGILGTVTGVITSFQGISGDAPDTGVMISGISVSMLTTAIGLIVALISLIPYNYFATKAYNRQLYLGEFLQECWSVRKIGKSETKDTKDTKKTAEKEKIKNHKPDIVVNNPRSAS
ncbi:MAG: MotA/TolQ/ExbB proton channel family protein [Verrucomicrobiota bacterium]|nr:MotA/TolQ/ExbB proton channel family protein [Verrucomicrobiota bacterium]